MTGYNLEKKMKAGYIKRCRENDKLREENNDLYDVIKLLHGQIDQLKAQNKMQSDAFNSLKCMYAELKDGGKKTTGKKKSRGQKNGANN